MRPKSLLLLVLALGCGLVASIGISQVMDRNANRGGATLETSPIYVALHNINLGDQIDDSMVSLQEWPKDKIPPGAIAELEDLEGRRPRATIIQGEPILDAKLLAFGHMADPITAIPHGFRLKTIKVDAEKSAAGLLSPGDRVDVQLFVKRNVQQGIDMTMTKVILQNIRVFAIDQAVQRSADGAEDRTIAKTISLLLTPEQASKLTLAEQLGVVSLIPRNPNDEEPADTKQYTLGDLLQNSDRNTREQEQVRDQADEPATNGGLLSAIQQPLPPPVPPFIMEVIEAQEVHEEYFDAETGRPIRDANESQGPSDSSSSGSSDTSGAVSDQSDEKMLDNFPIDFEQAD